MSHTSYRDVSTQKRHVRDEAIQHVVDSLPEPLAHDTAEKGFLEYLGADVTQIVRNIEQRKWTAVEVVTAYIWRAIKAQEATNCLTEGKCYTLSGTELRHYRISERGFFQCCLRMRSLMRRLSTQNFNRLDNCEDLFTVFHSARKIAVRRAVSE